jgi:hypothetical protein
MHEYNLHITFVLRWMRNQEVINSTYATAAERMEYLEAEVRRLTTRNHDADKAGQPRTIQKVSTATKKDNDGI